MGAERDEIDAPGPRRKRQFAQGLDRVGMDDRVRIDLPHGPHDFRDVLYRTDLVVHISHADKTRVRVDQLGQLVQADGTAAVHGNLAHRETFVLQRPHGLENRRVLDRAAKQRTPSAAHRAGGAPEGQIVRLGTAGSEDYLVAGHTGRRGHLFPDAANRRLRRQADGVGRRRVPEMYRKTLLYGSHYLRSHRGSGCMI